MFNRKIGVGLSSMESHSDISPRTERTESFSIVVSFELWSDSTLLVLFILIILSFVCRFRVYLNLREIYFCNPWILNTVRPLRKLKWWEKENFENYWMIVLKWGWNIVQIGEYFFFNFSMKSFHSSTENQMWKIKSMTKRTKIRRIKSAKLPWNYQQSQKNPSIYRLQNKYKTSLEQVLFVRRKENTNKNIDRWNQLFFILTHAHIVTCHFKWIWMNFVNKADMLNEYENWSF